MANTPEMKYGLIGAYAMRGQVERLGIEPLPNDPTIQHIMARHDRTLQSTLAELGWKR